MDVTSVVGSDNVYSITVLNVAVTAVTVSVVTDPNSTIDVMVSVLMVPKTEETTATEAPVVVVVCCVVRLAGRETMVGFVRDRKGKPPMRVHEVRIS